MCTSLSAGVGRGVEPHTKFSKRGVLTGPQLCEGVARKEGGNYFLGGVAIFRKSKIGLRMKNFNVWVVH